jgi:hypothetical protein
MIYFKATEDAFQVLNEEGIYYEDLHMDSLADEMKVDVFMENYNRFTLAQFEEFLKQLPK